jgi:hypothetical protein
LKPLNFFPAALVCSRTVRAYLGADHTSSSSVSEVDVVEMTEECLWVFLGQVLQQSAQGKILILTLRPRDAFEVWSCVIFGVHASIFC